MARYWRWATAIALLAIYAVWIQWWASAGFPLEHEICGVGENAKDCGSYNIFFYSAWTLGKALDHWSALITAIFTVVLSVSTIWLWKVTAQSASIAGRTLTDLERPWIFVHLAPKLRTRSSHFGQPDPHEMDKWLGTTLKIEDPPLAVFDIANHGRMPAVIDGCWVELGSVKIKWDDERNIIIPAGLIRDEFQGAIGPGERKKGLYLDCPAGVEYGIVEDIVTGQSDPQPIFQRDEIFVFSIEILYLDIAGNRHASHFCWRFDIGVNYWVQFGGPKYNYQT